MGRVRAFINNLQKSTKVTLISCGCFILLTFLILIFFVMFPITRAERANASVGRESVQRNAAAVTTATDINGSVIVSMGTTQKVDSLVTTTKHKDYVITVTTGKGFYSNGRIPTGDYSGDDYYSTDSVDGSEYVTVSPDEAIGYQPGYEEDPTEYVAPVATTAYSEEPIVTQPIDDSGVDPTDPPQPDPTIPPIETPTEAPATEAPAVDDGSGGSSDGGSVQ